MSRKWERMVQKNTKTINLQRKKTGATPLSGSNSDGAVVIKGRSWFLPILLVAVGLFCFIAFRRSAASDQLYWVTGASYIVLALLIFWVRRPYLKVGKQSITTRRFGGDRTLDASQITEISLSKDAVVLTVKPKDHRWVYTKLYHQFPMDKLQTTLREFAEKNSVQLKEE